MANTVMVTGADGFIGSHLTEELVRKGEKVKAFCYYNSFGTWGWLDTLPREIKNEIEVFMGDIRDPNGVRHAMEGQDIVYHLAALIAIPFRDVYKRQGRSARPDGSRRRIGCRRQSPAGSTIRSPAPRSPVRRIFPPAGAVRWFPSGR